MKRLRDQIRVNISSFTLRPDRVPSRSIMDYSDQDSFDRARFATVLQNLKRDRISSLASAIRYSGHSSTGIIDVPTTPQPISSRLLSGITCGSYNAVFTVLFADGTLWVLKAPAHGHTRCWDAPAAEALTSEAFTMRLVRRETTIPVPEVFAFDASLENELGCPFILMELIYGKSLAEVWFDQGISQPMREQVRIRSLQGIAEAMAQLNSLTFSQGGSLLFDATGNVAGIGSSNVVDLEKQYEDMRSEGYDNTIAFRQTGPFEDPKSYIMALLDAREGKPERGIIQQGAYKLLRLFIEWSLMDAGGQEKQFVLAHPDFDNQNILVKNDGSLTGIIDWDWTAAVPHCIGPQSLPKFLVQDYDPGNYVYDVEAGEPKEGFVADSPAELACYRAMYAQFMESYLSANDRVNLSKSRRHGAQVRKSRKEAADVTRRSLITSTLYLAVQAPSEMRGLMIHLFEELEELTAAQRQEESSTADAGDQDNTEEGGDKGENTETCEVENGDVMREESCIDNTVAEEDTVNIEHLSIDELVDEIEKLMGISSSGDSDRDTTQVPAAGPKFEAQSLETEHTKQNRKPRVARVCGWVKEKLRRGAKRPHKKAKKDDTLDSAAAPPSSMPLRPTHTFCGWTEKRLRRVATCLHCGDGDRDKFKMELKVEAVRNGGIDVLKSLQKKLVQLTQKLHRNGNDTSINIKTSGEKGSQNGRVASVSKEMTRAQKRSVCDKFTRMVRDKGLGLTVEQQVAVAHLVVQTLQDPGFSDSDFSISHDRLAKEAERHEDNSYHTAIDSGTDSGYEEGHEDGIRSSGNGEDGDEDTEEIGHTNNIEPNVEPTDQGLLHQLAEKSLSTESKGVATNVAETTSNEEGPGPVDTGVFDLQDICIALTKGDLDERRMQRLKDGFFGLLNQTL